MVSAAHPSIRLSLLTAAASACFAACGAPESAPAPSTLAALAAHQPARVLGAHVVDRVAAEEQIDLVIGLKLRDKGALDRLVRRQVDPRSGQYRRWLAPAAFADTFAVTANEYESLERSLESGGLAVTRRTDGRTTLSVRGRAADVERMFGTQLLLWEDARRSGSERFRAPSSAFVVPAELASIIDTVVGLDDANAYVSHRRGPLPGEDINALPGTAEPADLQGLYNPGLAKHPSTNQPLLGAGETVAILGTGFAPADTDVKNFVTKYTLPTNPAAQYVRVLLGGNNRDPKALANTEYGENVLDIDMVLSMSPLANVVHIFTAVNGGGLFSDGISFIVNQVPQAHAVSVSYGSCERVAVYEVLQMNALFLQAQTQGQAWFIASGDNGTDACRDGSSAGVPGVDWPASSPYVFGVGGTAISTGSEIAWFAGGGGESEIFPKPVWQEGIGPFPDDNARQVPDVSALAGDPGVATVFGNTVSPSQGTSAAAPIWAGIWALIDEARDNVGMADYHERVYALGKLKTGAFKDIVAGTNGDGTTPGYPAVVGFDLATGWGAPNVALLVGGLP